MGRRLKANNPTKKERRKPAPVEVRRLAHPAIWETALKLAEGKVERIRVDSQNRITILP